MAPEQVHILIALTLRVRVEDGRLLADGERVAAPDGPIYVSWYATTVAEEQAAIAGGLAHVRRAADAPPLKRDPIRSVAPADNGDGFSWREPAAQDGPLMFAMCLPPGQTLRESEPRPVEAKEHNGAVAVFWILPPSAQVLLRWQLGQLRAPLVEEVRRINREGLDQLLPTRSGGFEYDVAFSAAGEDRRYVEQVATSLKRAGVKVFYDGFEEVASWGKNLYDHLSEIYGTKARYTVMFISQHYVNKVWTGHERQIIQARSLESRSECILPVRFDDTKVPGLPATMAYLSLDGRDPKDLADLIVQKLKA